MERVATGCEAWSQGRLTELGQLITASGASSVENFESGSPPLVELWERLRATPGVLGTRFSGAGFGGSCLVLARPDTRPALEQTLERLGLPRSALHPCQPGPGVLVLERSDIS